MKMIIPITLCLLSCGLCTYASNHDNRVKATITTRELQQPQHTIDSYTLNDVGWACLKGDLEGLKVLIADGGSFEECMEDEIYMFDAMYAAVYGGQKHVVDYLIEKGLNVNRFYTEDGETPLFMACRRNRTDIADALLRAGADANGAGDRGGDYTLYPLIEAVYNRNLALAKLLVEYGAAVDITNKQGESPLASAIRNEDEVMISFLKQSIGSTSISVKKCECSDTVGCSQ